MQASKGEMCRFFKLRYVDFLLAVARKSDIDMGWNK